MFKRLISARNLSFNFNSPLKTNQFVFFFESNIFMNEYANLNVTTFDRLNVLFAHSKNNLFLTIHDELVLRLPHFYEPSKVGEFYQLCVMARNAQKIFVPSMAESRNVARHFDKTQNLVVIPWVGGNLNPKNANKLANIASVDKVFLHFSGSDFRKNTERVIKAFAIMHSEYDNLELHIIGRKPADDSTVYQVIASLDVEKKRIFFHSRLSDNELVLLYERSLVLVYCSLAEGYGLPIVEAANHSCVVVASNFGSMAEVATKYSHHCLVDPYDIRSISNGMENALAGKVAAPQEKGQVARDWDTVAKDILIEIVGQPDP
jgi:glycosyltransferase involved in cell wall biosynthesis